MPLVPSPRVLPPFVYTALLLFAATPAVGQVIIADTDPVTENFDGLGTSNSATIPAGWQMSAAGAGLTANWNDADNFTAVNLAASSGSPTTGGRYNWGRSGDTTDRALGFMTSGSYASPNSILARYRNQTGEVIEALGVSFDVERYRVNTNGIRVLFYVSSDGSTWTEVEAGGIPASAFPTGANSYTFADPLVVSRDFVIDDLQVENDTDLYLRWVFENVSGNTNSQGLGLDNVAVAANPQPPSAPVISLQNATQTVTEGQVATATAVLSNVPEGGLTAPLSVDFALTAGEATFFDPSYTTQAFTFPVDATNGATASIALPTAATPTFTGDRTAIFALVDGEGFDLGTPNTYTLTILDAQEPSFGIPIVDNEPVVIDFQGYDGTGPPPNWTSSIADGSELWRGVDTGSLQSGGGRSYGLSGSTDRALGFLGAGTPETATFTVQFVNDTGEEITSLRVGYDAEQWRRASGGRLSTWDVAYRIGEGAFVPIPALAFTATNEGATGALNPALVTPLEALLADISLPEGETFELRYTGDRGAGSGSAQGIAIDNLTVTANPPATVLAGPSAWRLLAPPTGAVSPEFLSTVSLVQGVPGSYPNAETNLFTGYTGNNNATDRGFTEPGAFQTPLPPGRGFIWYHWDSPIVVAGSGSQGVGLPVTLFASGSAPTTSQTATFESTERGSPDDGYFMLGNPFARPFCLGRLSAGSGTLSTTAFRYVPADPDGPTWVEVSTSDSVAVWDGFFVQVTNNDIPLAFPLMFTFDADAGCPAERLVGETVRLALELIGTVGGTPVADRAAVVAFNPEASDYWDRHDATKLRPLSSPHATIAPFGVGPALNQEWVRKAVESRPWPEAAVEIPLSLQTTGAGTFTLRLAEGVEVPETWSVTLRDTYTNVTVDLRVEPLAFTMPVAVQHAPRFTLRIEPQGVSTEAPSASAAFGLETVYPNPAAERATVVFALAEAGDARVTVFDVLGRPVRVLAEGAFGAGRHAVEVEASGLASGSYVVRLEAGGQVATQRLTIIR